jgi:hypothetical protein
MALYAGLLALQAWRLGVTVDEPSHLVRAHSYWLGITDVFPPDTPLSYLVSGWVPALLRSPLKFDTNAGRRKAGFEMGSETLGAMTGPEAKRIVFFARLPYLVFPILTVWLLWRWARELFSETTALVVAVGAALEPTFFGHASLMKSDVAGAFGCVLLSYEAWRHWREPSRAAAVRLSLALLVAVLAKFSLLICVPLVFALFLYRGPRIFGPVVAAPILYVGILASYQFRDLRPLAPEDFRQMADQRFTPAEIRLAKLVGRVSWPVAFQQGIRYLEAANRNQGFPAYLLGRKIEYSAPLYFPLAWAVKTPIALQVLELAGVVYLILRALRLQVGAAEAFVYLPAALLVVSALRSHIHMGLRHIMPVLPLLILGAGFAVEALWRRKVGRLVVAGCVSWLVVASAWIYPQGLAYFNEWVGGPKNGWKYLADSNIDWGQNFPELARYVERNRIPKIKISYFGYDAADHYLPPEKFEDLDAPWDVKFVKSTRLDPSPGVYAISVNMLLGYFFPPGYQDYFGYFRERQPVARAGWSILIYEVK